MFPKQVIRVLSLVACSLIRWKWSWYLYKQWKSYTKSDLIFRQSSTPHIFRHPIKHYHFKPAPSIDAVTPDLKGLDIKRHLTSLTLSMSVWAVMPDWATLIWRWARGLCNHRTPSHCCASEPVGWPVAVTTSSHFSSSSLLFIQARPTFILHS